MNNRSGTNYELENDKLKNEIHRIKRENFELRKKLSRAESINNNLVFQFKEDEVKINKITPKLSNDELEYAERFWDSVDRLYHMVETNKSKFNWENGQGDIYERILFLIIEYMERNK